MGVYVFEVAIQHLAVCFDDASVDVGVSEGWRRPRRLAGAGKDVRVLGVVLWGGPGEVARTARRQARGDW